MASKVELEVGIKSGAVATGLAQIKGQFMKLRQTLNSDLGTAISIGGLVAGAVQISESLDRVKDLGDRFGETAESIQRADVAARLFGSDIEAVARGIGKVTLNAYQATKNGGEMAENFKKIGIEATSFVNLPLEAKIVALSEAYQKATGSGEGLAEMQSVMGRSAAELIPLLAQGPAAIKATMDEALVASQNVVDAVDTFYDRLVVVKQAAAVFFGFIVQGILSIASTWGAATGGMIGVQRALFTALKDGWVQYSLVVKNAFFGNFTAAKEAAQQIPGIFSKALEESSNAISGAALEVRNQLDEIWNKEPATKPAGPALFDEGAAEAAAEAAKKKADEEKRRAEEIAALRGRVSEAERDNYLASLSAQERINELFRERLALQTQLTQQTDEKERLETQLKLEDVNKDIRNTTKSMQSEQERADEERERKRVARASVVADFLAEIGGGGRTGGGVDPIVYEQRRGNTLLERIEQNTRNNQPGSRPDLMKP